MPTDDARLTAVETELRGLRSDVRELKDEELRTRGRLHDAEGVLGVLVEQEKLRRRASKDRADRLDSRIRVLTFVVLLATAIGPIFYHFAGGQ